MTETKRDIVATRRRRLMPPGCVLVMSLILTATAAVGQEQERHLRFLGNQAIPPFVSLEDGRPVGIVVDLAYALANRAGLSIAVEAMDWPTAQSEVLHGHADALLQINSNAQREQSYDFSDTLVESRFQIFRKASRIDIHSLESLRGEKVGVESGGFPAQTLGARNEFQLVTVPTWKAAFILLNAGQIDAVVVDRWVGELELAINRFAGITVVDPPVTQSYSRIAVAKGNRELLDKINFGLRSIKEDGTYQRILDKWGSKDVVYVTRQALDRLLYFGIAAGGAIVAGVSIRFLHRARLVAARKALAESEARLRTIVETVPVGLVMAELPSGRIIGSNSCAETLLGDRMLRTPGGHSYGEWVAFHANGTRVDGNEYPLARMMLYGEENPSIEVHYQRGDGTRVWTRIMGRPVRNAEGRITGGVVALLDVDSERRARESLEHSQARLNDLVTTLNLGMFLIRELNGTIRFWSDGCSRLLHWTSEEAVGKRSADLLHTKYAATLPEIMETIKSIGVWNGDAQVRTRDGRDLAIQVRIAARRNPETGETELLEALTDVTALRQSEQRFRALITASSEVFYAMNPDWTVLRELNGGRALPHTAVPDENWLDTYIPSDEQPRVKAAIQQAVRTGDVFELEHRVWLADGTVGWMFSRAVPLLDPTGNVREWFGVAGDVTARRSAENALTAREAEAQPDLRS